MSFQRWIYIDESQAPSKEGTASGKPFRVGALITASEVPQTLIDWALDELRKDPDSVANKMDQDTLSRGFFHATFDSKNAHSWLCKAIAADVTGRARFTHWDFDQEQKDEKSGGPLHQLMVLLASVSTFEAGCHRINLIVASRQGTFEQRHADAFPEFAIEQGLGSISNIPKIPHPFPEIDVQLVNGNEPGVQVVDFLLWAAQRANYRLIDGTFVYSGNTDWMERLGARHDSSFQVEDDPLGETRWFLGSQPPDPHDPSFEAPPRDLADLDPNVVFRFVLDRVNEAPSMLASIPLLAALGDRVTEELNEIKEMDLAAARRAFASLYLRLCDTIPLYDVQDPADYAAHAEGRMVANGVWTGQLICASANDVAAVGEPPKSGQE